jgi:hypothetical protein
MELIQLETLKSTYEDFLKEISLRDTGNQKRDIVYARAAWANAFRPNARVVDLAKVLGKHHATIVYYNQIHMNQMVYTDYAAVYQEALRVRNRYINDEPTEEMTMHRLKRDLLKKIEQNISLENKLKTLQAKYENETALVKDYKRQVEKLKSRVTRLLVKAE